MQGLSHVLQILVFILIAVSVPLVIFLPARKFAEWAIGLLLLFAIVFYYSITMVNFFSDHHFLTGWPITSLNSYRMFVLHHWPQFNGITIFGSNFLKLKVDYHFASTFFPIILLWVGGIVRFVVVRYVPHNRLREVTHEYWLYITSLFIILLIINNVYDLNFLIILLLFLLVLVIIATGLYRIFSDFVILIIKTARHVGRLIMSGVRRLRIGLRYLALIAVHIAKFLNKILRRIRELYDKYVRRPFRWLDERLNELERKEEVSTNAGLKRITQVLTQQSLDDQEDREEVQEEVLPRQATEEEINTVRTMHVMLNAYEAYIGPRLSDGTTSDDIRQKLSAALNDFSRLPPEIVGDEFTMLYREYARFRNSGDRDRFNHNCYFYRLSELGAKISSQKLNESMPGIGKKLRILRKTRIACEKLLQAPKPYPDELITASIDALEMFNHLDAAACDPRFHQALLAYHDVQKAINAGTASREREIQCGIELAQIAVTIANEQQIP